MEKNLTEAIGERPQKDRTIGAPLVSIDLPSFIKQIRNEKTWKESGRNAITVFKTTGLRIILIAMHKGAEMIDHTADGLMSLQVLEGLLLFNTKERSVELDKGEMLALRQGISHSLVAKEETVFLLTLTASSTENNADIKARILWNNIL